MAHFRALIRGARGEASRLGGKGSGITAKVQTWGWDVAVSVVHNGKEGKDAALVELVNHDNGQRIPLLDLNLSAKDHTGAVTFVYRTVDEHRGIDA